MNSERDECFGGSRQKRDYIDIISFGTFLLIVGVLFVLNPNIFSEFGLWIEDVSESQSFVRPPAGLIYSAMIFFSLLGVSDFFKALIRLFIGRSRRKMLGNILSGTALVLFAYLILLYYNLSIEWHAVLAIEMIIVGLLVILYSTIRFKLEYNKPVT